MNFDPKNRQHLLIMAAIAVVALFLGERLVFTPVVNGWKARSARLEELKRKVGAGEVLLTRSESLRSRWSMMRTNALASGASEAERQLSGAFERWSQVSGVSVTSYRPQWKRAGDDFMTLECRADIGGSLAEVTRFLFEIENDPMGVKVDSASMVTRDTDGAQITLGLQVSALQLLSTSP
jgi:hypothetical protein